MRRYPKARWVIHQARLPRGHVPTTAACHASTTFNFAAARRTMEENFGLPINADQVVAHELGRAFYWYSHPQGVLYSDAAETIKLHWIGRTLSATSLTTGKGTTHDQAHHGCLSSLSPCLLGPQASTGWGGSLTHYGPLCKVTADCSAGLECMPHRDFAHREVRRTCERPCRTDADCTKGLACKIVDHGPRSTVGGVCMKP